MNLKMKEKTISKERLLYLKKRRIGLFFVHFTRILILLFFIGLWEFLARIEYIDSFLFSMPQK